jgi:cytochrome c553
MRLLTGGWVLSAIVYATAAFAAAPAPAPKADLEKGKQTAAAICAACHGPDGNSPTAANPNLAGQHEDYIRTALTAYQTGQRKNAVMAGMAQPLKDHEIVELARYYSSQRPALCSTDETRKGGKCKGL